MEKEKIVQALAIITDMYMTEFRKSQGVDSYNSIIAKVKADAVNECIDLIEQLDI